MGADTFDHDLPRAVHHVGLPADAIHPRGSNKILAHRLRGADREAEGARLPGRHHDRAFPGRLAMVLGRAVGKVLLPFDDLLVSAFGGRDGFFPRQQGDVPPLAGSDDCRRRGWREAWRLPTHVRSAPGMLDGSHQGTDAQPFRLAPLRRLSPRKLDAARTHDLHEETLARLEADVDERRGRRLADLEEPVAIAALDPMIEIRVSIGPVEDAIGGVVDA